MKKIRLTVTAFFSIIILFTAFIIFFRLQTEAANRSTGDLKVTGASALTQLISEDSRIMHRITTMIPAISAIKSNIPANI